MSKTFLPTLPTEQLYCETCSRFVTKEDIEKTVNGDAPHKNHNLVWINLKMEMEKKVNSLSEDKDSSKNKVECPRCGSHKVTQEQDEDTYYLQCQECGQIFGSQIKWGFG